MYLVFPFHWIVKAPALVRGSLCFLDEEQRYHHLFYFRWTDLL